MCNSQGLFTEDKEVLQKKGVFCEEEASSRSYRDWNSERGPERPPSQSLHGSEWDKEPSVRAGWGKDSQRTLGKKKRQLCPNEKQNPTSSPSWSHQFLQRANNPQVPTPALSQCDSSKWKKTFPSFKYSGNLYRIGDF